MLQMSSYLFHFVGAFKIYFHVDASRDGFKSNHEFGRAHIDVVAAVDNEHRDILLQWYS